MTQRRERTYDSTEDLTSNQHPTNRLTVADAARLLGVSAEAVRMRIKRGTIVSEKVDGTVYAILEGEQTRSNGDQTTNQTNEQTSDQTALVEVLQDQVSHLRDQLDQEREANRENRRIIAGLVQRVPELEPARESQEAPQNAGEASEEEEEDRGTPGGQQEALERRSWWRKLFGS